LRKLICFRKRGISGYKQSGGFTRQYEGAQNCEQRHTFGQRSNMRVPEYTIE